MRSFNSAQNQFRQVLPNNGLGLWESLSPPPCALQHCFLLLRFFPLPSATMTGRLSKEEWRKQKDLEAARKAGTAPAERDEEGNAINPHIPQFMAQAPWYVDTGRPSLKHQRKPEPTSKVPMEAWYVRGKKDTRAKKWEKGACENCGARTHKTKDCLERPRKRGAKWTNMGIAADDAAGPPPELSALDEDYDAKRDRWNGYDPNTYADVIDTYAAVDAERGRRREAELDAGVAGDAVTRKAAKKDKGKDKKEGDISDSDFSSDSDASEDEEKYAEKASMAGQKVDKEKRMTVRNLRIREDRAKYLYNLDPDSAYYDPKTRSMREAPDQHVRPEDAQYAGDNFVRASGDALKFQQMQLFAWQAEARGAPGHMQANPTVSEMQYRDFSQRRDKVAEHNRQSLLDRYGGAEHLAFNDGILPRELRQGQHEDYVEYTRTGQVARGRERARPSSKYQEDQLDVNHTAVWGSWYDVSSGQWGYACCHATIRGTYCTGKAGIEAAEMSSAGALLQAHAKRKALESDASAEKDGNGEQVRKRAKSSHSPSPAEEGSRRRRKSHRSRSSRSPEREGEEGEHRHRSHRHHHHRHRSQRDKDKERTENGTQRRDKADTGYVSRKHLGEGDVSSRLDRSKLTTALQDENRRQRGLPTQNAHKIGAAGAGNGIDVSEEQLEAYRMKKDVYDDPMRGYQDNAL